MTNRLLPQVNFSWISLARVPQPLPDEPLQLLITGEWREAIPVISASGAVELGNTYFTCIPVFLLALYGTVAGVEIECAGFSLPGESNDLAR